MHIRCTVACFILVAVPFHVMAQPDAPTLFAAAIEGAAARPQPLSYDVTVEQQTGPLHYTVNPGATGLLRLTAISPAENKLDQRGRALIQRARSTERDIWCASHNLSGATDVQLVREDETSAVYSFTPPAAQFGGKQGASMIKYVHAEATVLKASADISEVRISLTHPLGGLVMKMDKFSVYTRCEPAENGRNFAAETVSEFAGSVPLTHFNEHSVEHITNLRLAD